MPGAILPGTGLGWVKPEWRTHVGSVVVVRNDKKPLLLGHAAALVHFCWDHLTDKFQANWERSLDGENDDNDVLQEIAEDKFKEHFQGWQSEQTMKEWREMPSLYDM